MTLMTQQEEVSVIARVAFGLTIALALWPRAALALTGNELLKRCEDNDAVQRAFCVGYVIGVADMVEEGPSGLICVATGVSNGQLSDIVVKFLRDHPERRHYSANSLVGVALMETYPCQDEPGAQPK